MQCVDLFGLKKWALAEIFVYVYVHIPMCSLFKFLHRWMWMCGEQKRPEGIELMRKCVPVSYNFVLLDRGKVASPSSQDECDSWP